MRSTTRQSTLYSKHPDVAGSKYRRALFPPIGSMVFAIALVVGMSIQAGPSPGPGVLSGPGGSRLHVQDTSGPGSSFTPYTPGELWGGGNMLEQCLACNLETASGQPAGQSIQAGQQVNPATGDFTYTQSLFSVPAIGGSLGINLIYDAQEASTIIGCALPGAGAECDGVVTKMWPDFGIGWKADQFPAEATWVPTGTSTTFIQVQEPNGSEATFVGNGSSPTCGQGSYSTASSYTVSGSSQNFCAPYRVDAQIGQFSGYTMLYVQGGRQTITFSNEYATPSYIGNIANENLLTYDATPATPGAANCPSTVPTGFGTVDGCWLVTGSPGQTMSVVFGPPSNDSEDTDDVLEVVDPGDYQPYVFAWYTDSSSVFNEPEVISSVNDSSIATYFQWTFSLTSPGYFDSMSDIETLDPGDAGELITYNSQGQVTSTTDHSESNTTSYSYVEDPSGCTPCLVPGDSVQTTVSYPDGEVDVDSYLQGILQADTFGTGSDKESIDYSVTYPIYPSDQDDPITETFGGPVFGETGPLQVTTAETNAVGNIIWLEDAEGNYFTSPYNPNNFDEMCWSAPGNYTPTCGIDSAPSGATTYEYDDDGDVISATDPLGNTTNYGYDDDMLLCWVAPPTVSVPDDPPPSPCGAPNAEPEQAPPGSTAYQYDTDPSNSDYSDGNLACTFVSYNETDQETTYATYDTDGEMTAYYTPDTFGSSSWPCAGTPSDQNYETSYQYVNGEMTKETDPDDLVTKNTYYYGLLEEVKDPTGYTIAAYDGDGRPCWTSRAGLGASIGSVPFSCTETPVGSETKYTYLADTDAAATVTDPRNYPTTYSYTDTAYPTLPTTITDPADEAITYNTYDANGDLCITGTFEESSCTWHDGDTYDTYDYYGDVVTTEDPSGNTTTYGRTDSAFPTLVTSVTEPMGSESSEYYNADGQPYQLTLPSGDINTVGYDADGRQCWRAVGGATGTCLDPPEGSDDSAWSYNLDGTVSEMTDSVGSSEVTTKYKYYPDQQVKSVKDDNGNTVRYAYNYADQVTCIAYPSSTTTNCNNMPSSSNPIVTYGYASDGLLSSTTDWLGNEMAYGYSTDGLNNLTSVDYPTSSPDSVTYGYNADSDLTSLTYGGTDLSSLPEQTWEYNPDDLVDNAVQLDGPTSTSYYTSNPTYDGSQQRNWIATTTNPGASGADSYTYNSNGEIASDTPPVGSATSYNYNDDSQLTSSSSPSDTYTYTADGQRCWSMGSSITDASCSEPPTSGATGYAWNNFGEMCWSGPISGSTPSCESPPSGATTYTYDGDGNRMTETSPSSGTEDFTWNTTNSTPLLLEDGTNAYIYGPLLFGENAPLEQINLSGTPKANYLTSDPSGIQMVLKQGGAIDNDNVSSYSTYGVPDNSSSSPCSTGSSDPSCTPFGYAGGYTDASGLIYLIHRYYDPTTGQFLSIDPDVAASGEAYAYAGDDPLNATDPTGLMPDEPDGTSSEAARNQELAAEFERAVARDMFEEAVARDMFEEAVARDMFEAAVAREMFEDAALRRIYDKVVWDWAASGRPATGFTFLGITLDRRFVAYGLKVVNEVLFSIQSFLPGAPQTPKLDQGDPVVFSVEAGESSGGGSSDGGGNSYEGGGGDGGGPSGITGDGGGSGDDKED
jgi:RHS repeat-associated protein